MEKELGKLYFDYQNNAAQLLKDIVFKASSHDINVQLVGIKEVRSVASRELNPPIDQLVGLGIIPILVDCLKKGNEELELEATSTLAIIAAGSLDSATKIFAAGAVPRLIELLSSPSESLRESVVQILRHMLNVRSKLTSECFRRGVVDHVVKSVTPDASSSFVQSVSRFVSDWYEIEDYSPEDSEMLFRFVSCLLTREDLCILDDSISLISSLVNEVDSEVIIESGVIKQLVPFLSHDDNELKTSTVKALFNIIYETDEEAQIALDNGLLRYLPELLLSSNHELISDALWLLSSIAGGTQEQIQAVIDAGFIPSIIKALSEESYENRGLAVDTVSKISENGSTEQIMFLVDNGVIPPLCTFLTISNEKLLVAALETMNNILKSSEERQVSIVLNICRCGGFHSLQTLERRIAYKIPKLASTILSDVYRLAFQEEEQGEEELMNFEENC